MAGGERESFGSVGHLNSYFCPIVAGVAKPVKSESRFEESSMPFETRQLVGVVVRSITSR